jgi:hypothetical protein
MRVKRFIFLTVLLSGPGLIGIQAQQIHEAIPAAGSEASGSGGSVNYSVGQVFYIHSSGTAGSVSQGVQQPYEIFVVVGMDEAGYMLSVSAFPNPANDFLQLEVESEDSQDLSYRLFDFSGKLLENKRITSNNTGIDISNLVPATYFLKVMRRNKEVKVFKIIKN